MTQDDNPENELVAIIGYIIGGALALAGFAALQGEAK